jgi:DNA-binding GntR family transcriptional regulator
VSTPSGIERAAADLAAALAKSLNEATAAVRSTRLPDAGIRSTEFHEMLVEACGAVRDPDSAADSAQNDLAWERADAIVTFIELARDHSLPRKLLPRGDQPGEDFEVGEEVIVIGGVRGA